MQALLRLLRESLPEIIAGLVIMAIGALISVLVARLKSRTRRSPKERQVVVLSSTSPALSAIPDSELIAKFQLQRHQIVVKIHSRYCLELDDKVMAAFSQLNAQRESQGLKPLYAATRFRPVQAPLRTENGIQINVAPMNFVYLALLKDAGVSPSVKKYIQEQVERLASRVPKSLQSSHTILNWYNCYPLGVSVLILTKDGKTLFRKRGASVLTETNKWDSSFSGYCGNCDRIDSELDIGLTVEHELVREIGVVSADNRAIAFTGLHRNTASGATNMLGVWKMETHSNEVARLLTEKYAGTTKVFETTKRAIEPFVWDADNVIVEFRASQIVQAFGESDSLIRSLIPETSTCLLLGLEMLGQSISGLT